MDRSKLWIRLYTKANFPEYQILHLMVPDFRVDSRPGSHTSIGIFLPLDTERSAIENLSKDTEGLKALMEFALEKADSPLRGATQEVTQSFLV